jgi:hypothetical protein
MKITIKELKAMIQREVVAEAKRKKVKKEDQPANKVQPAGYQKPEVLDFSKPENQNHRLKIQGASNIGPYTSEGALRLMVREAIRSSISKVVVEKHIGFKKLKNKLSKKDVADPAALAAAIGRKKYGDKAYAAKVAAGRKKK